MEGFVSKKIRELPPSGIRAFFDLVLGARDVISLGVGEPDFITPWRIREKAIYSIEQGYTSYTSNKGLFRLRLEIAHFLKKQYGLVYDPEEEILITSGVSQALDLVMRVILNSQDKVGIVFPAYVAYPAVVELSGGRVSGYNTSSENNFKITPSSFSSFVNKNKLRVVIFNYPANPTGVSYTKEELKEIWSILKKKEILIVSDEIYDFLTFDFKHTPFASLKGAKRRTVYLGGFSKNFAMTGWRVGFACGPKEIISAMTKIHSFVMLCASIISQLAAVEALYSLKEVELMRREYRRRRDFIVDRLNRLGLVTPLPQGTFYCFSSIKHTGLTSLDFARRLFAQGKVAVVPGVAFGRNYKDFIRISFASPFKDLKEALIRIEKFLSQLQT